jgi:hypothetical protein
VAVFCAEKACTRRCSASTCKQGSDDTQEGVG